MLCTCNLLPFKSVCSDNSVLLHPIPAAENEDGDRGERETERAFEEFQSKTKMPQVVRPRRHGLQTW